MKKYYLEYEESHSGGGISPGQEDDPWPSREPSYTHASFLGLYRNLPNNYHNHEIQSELDIPVGETAYVVIVTYSTGDTFGTAHGHWTVVDIFDNEDAARDLDHSISEGSYKGYAPWDGYFEHLEDVQIHAFKVQETQYKDGTPSAKIIYH